MGTLLISEAKLTELANLLGAARDSLRAQGDVYGKMEESLIALSLTDADNNPGPTVYGQRDPRWSTRHLGTSASTIGAEGCLVTALASVVTDASGDPQWTPPALHDWLLERGGFVNDDGSQDNAKRMVWATIDALGIVRYQSKLDYNNPAPMEQIEKHISAGGYVLVKVDFDRNTRQVEQHWCRYLGDGKIVDPWYGDVADIVPRYRGNTPAAAIWSATYYVKA